MCFRTVCAKYYKYHKNEVSGHLYQGRFKSFPVQPNNHYISVLRYIEANPVKAQLVTDVKYWQWSSYHQHIGRNVNSPVNIQKTPVELPEKWEELVNKVTAKKVTDDIQNAIKRGCPLGEQAWKENTAEKQSLEITLRPKGRPRVWGTFL